MHRRPLTILLLLLLSPVAAIACQICIPIPTKSAADHFLAADVVALARENPDKPFFLAATDVLKGKLAAPPIDLFLDSTTRRILATNPDRHVVCTRRDDSWQRIATTTPEIELLIRQILKRAPSWRDQPDTRVSFFAPLLGNPDRSIRTLAHLEVGGASYSQIRELGEVLPRTEVRAFLDDFRMIEWHALYILLLAQSNEPADLARIEDALHSAAQFSTTTQLAAWTTASIETRGGDALEFIRQHYAENPDRTPAETTAVLLALSVQGGNSPAMRDGIIDTYTRFLPHHPETLVPIIEDLTKWQRGDLTGPVSRILNDPTSDLPPATALQLRAYLRDFAPTKPGTTPKPLKTQLVFLLIGLVLLAPATAFLTRKRRTSAPAQPLDSLLDQDDKPT